MPQALGRLVLALEKGRASGDPMRGVASVEVGGSGVEYVVGYFDQPDGVFAGPVAPASMAGLHSCFAAPGLVSGGHVRGAHQMAWMDTDAGRNSASAASRRSA